MEVVGLKGFQMNGKQPSQAEADFLIRTMAMEPGIRFVVRNREIDDFDLELQLAPYDAARKEIASFQAEKEIHENDFEASRVF